MKSLLVALTLMMSLNTYAQEKMPWEDPDSVGTKQLREAMIYMRENLDKAHTQFQTGLIIGVSGIAISAYFTSAATEKTESNKSTFVWIGLSVGSALDIVASIIMIDSHKYIGRAGRWKFTANGISLDF